MKIMKQIAIIFSICIVAEAIGYFLPFKFPSSLISLIIVAALLLLGVLKENDIKETSDFLVSVMAALFVPMGVGAVGELMAIKEKGLIIFLIMLSPVVTTFLASYFATDFAMKFQNKLKKKKRTNNDKDI